MFDKKKLMTFLGTFALVALWSVSAFAQGGAADNDFTVAAYLAIGAGIGLGVAAFGSALGQGRAAASALEGIGRNPGSADEMFVPLLISLAFMEALTIYSLIIAFLLNGHIGAVIG